MSKVLTIAVPTYNMEKYLNNCLDSFIDQRIMDDIEVIVVNDGSKDKSAEIAKEYTKKYPNTFKLNDKENGGHGSAVNSGIKLASGKYFKIVDSDDWVITENLVRLVNELKDLDIDVVYNDYDECYEESGKTVTRSKTGVTANTVFNYREHLNKGMMVMHKTTFKTDVLKSNNVALYEHCFYVDTQYLIFPMAKINTGIYLPYVIYKYRLERKDQSVSPERLFKLLPQREKVFVSLFEYFKNNKELLGSDYKKMASVALSAFVPGLYGQIFLYYQTKQELKILKDLDKKLKTEYKDVYKHIKFPLRVKIILMLNFKGIRFFRFIQNIFIKDVRGTVRK